MLSNLAAHRAGRVDAEVDVRLADVRVERQRLRRLTTGVVRRQDEEELGDPAVRVAWIGAGRHLREVPSGHRRPCRDSSGRDSRRRARRDRGCRRCRSRGPESRERRRDRCRPAACPRPCRPPRGVGGIYTPGY